MGQDTELPVSDDREIRIMEIRAGVKKVIYGTTIGALAVSFFPFAQETSRALFEFLTAERQERTIRQADERSFLESLKDEARSKNLEDRIVLAEYYASVSPDLEKRKLWDNFLKLLTQQRLELRNSQIEAEKLRLSSLAEVSVSEEELKAAEAALRASQLQISAAAGGTSPIVSESFQALLVQLESPDPTIRRTARSALARLGTGLVRPAMAELLTADLSYRVRLGLIVALAEMLRENKRERAAIILMIEHGALNELLRLATDPDRTIRIYAGEFLFDLGDPRVFDLVSNAWLTAGSDDGRFNLALAMKGAAPFVPQDRVQAARDVISDKLGVVGSRTDALLEDAQNLLP